MSKKKYGVHLLKDGEEGRDRVRSGVAQIISLFDMNDFDKNEVTSIISSLFITMIKGADIGEKRLDRIFADMKQFILQKGKNGDS